jgi:hypothetical protein
MRMFADSEDETIPKFALRSTSALVAATSAVAMTALCALLDPSSAQAQSRPPNIVMLMTDDTGWQDFGAYTAGGAALGHPTPNVDRIAKEGATFTSWYGQASCTAGRASFITGRIPIRSALSIVVAPGDKNYLRKETPTIAEFFQKNGYSTYFSGKWHLGDIPDSYPTVHGFDEMQHFAAYYAGVYAYDDTANGFHPWFPSFNPEFKNAFETMVNLGEWEGKAGEPAKKVGTITYDSLSTFDERQTDTAVDYIKQHAKDDKPFFMDWAHHVCHSRRGAQHDRHRDGRQRRLARCLSRCRDDPVPRREGIRVRRRLAGPGHHVVARPRSGRRQVRRDDVAYRLLGDARRDGRPHAAAARLGRQ